MDQNNADALILFGITGDLAKKRLFPALYQLADSGQLEIPIVGVARSDGDDESLRNRARDALEAAEIDVDDVVFERLADNLSYVQGDYQNPSTYRDIGNKVGDTRCSVAYLAIPPELFDDVISGLASEGLNAQGRVVVEKPFGRDTASAANLNRIVGSHYPESRVYRIDHFLGKEALQNLMVFRFSNTMLEPIWNRHYIRGIQITMAEDFGLEGRAGFYETAGAMRDVVQNHLLVLMSLLAMEPPVNEHPDALRDERVKVLRATRSLGPAQVVRGQYQGYRSEPGVASDSDTETFFAARFEIDSWRWAGVPWVVRTGKNLAETVTEAVVEFNRPPRMFFADEKAKPGPNLITFRSKPEDRIILSMQAKKPGPDLVSHPVNLTWDHDNGLGQDAYHRLLGDALRGDQALFAREDGVMESWRIVEPALEAPAPVVVYEQQSWGPAETDLFIDDGWKWWTR